MHYLATRPAAPLRPVVRVAGQRYATPVGWSVGTPTQQQQRQAQQQQAPAPKMSPLTEADRLLTAFALQGDVTDAQVAGASDAALQIIKTRAAEETSPTRFWPVFAGTGGGALAFFLLYQALGASAVKRLDAASAQQRPLRESERDALLGRVSTSILLGVAALATGTTMGVWKTLSQPQTPAQSLYSYLRRTYPDRMRGAAVIAAS